MSAKFTVTLHAELPDGVTPRDLDWSGIDPRATVTVADVLPDHCPRHVSVVDVGDVDGLYVFADGDDAEEFAKRYDGATVGEEVLLDHERAVRLIANVDAEREAEDRDEEGQSELLCDTCWETANPGLVAECEDFCALPLDHEGLCAERSLPGTQTACDRCGAEDRLHPYEE